MAALDPVWIFAMIARIVRVRPEPRPFPHFAEQDCGISGVVKVLGCGVRQETVQAPSP